MAAGPPSLAPEWQRLALLARCLAAGQSGAAPTEEDVARLAAAQDEVRVLRDTHPGWQRLAAGGLDAMACDILACALAPEAEPRLAALYQSLQPGPPQPWATPALIQELLALEGDEVAALHAALAAAAPLRRQRLVELDGSEAGTPFRTIRPGIAALALLLGRDPVAEAPAGTAPVPPAAGWEALVLPPIVQRALLHFTHWITKRELVRDAWGAEPPGGPTALFVGPPGTGKTLAARAIAGVLGWPLFRADLAQLVSKWIGETERNLSRLLDAAHGRPMILLFDEADSLFGRRAEVRDARDRWANLEVSHLLSRIETHEGPVILTTNLREHLDRAFLRRFQAVIEFPRPDAPARRELWAMHLPPRAPREAGVDPAVLGAALPLSGGAIHNAAVAAAFLAAGEDRPIGLCHVALAVAREIAKEGRTPTAAELGPLAAHLPEDLL